MPVRTVHKEFDKYLSERGILLPDASYDRVHEFIDRGIYTFGAQHRELDIYHQEEGLRSWLHSKYNIIGQDLATDWLRAGLGHFCLDEADSSLNGRYSQDSLFDSAYLSMAQRGWTKVKFVRK
ncbi:MAG: hypothetical protein WBB67_06415 [bacterium]